jgi:hypothetical protein
MTEDTVSAERGPEHWISYAVLADLASAQNAMGGYITAAISDEDRLVAAAATRLLSAAVALLYPLADEEHAFSAHHRKAPVTSDASQRRLTYAEEARNRIGDAVAHLDKAERAALVVSSGGDTYCDCREAVGLTCPNCGLPFRTSTIGPGEQVPA